LITFVFRFVQNVHNTVVFLSTCGLLMVGYILLPDSVTSLLLLRRLKCGNQNDIRILYSKRTNLIGHTSSSTTQFTSLIFQRI